MVHLHTGVHMFFGFWMQNFQIGRLGEMVRHPGHHDRRISPSLHFFLWRYVKDKVFSTPCSRYYKFEGKNNRRLCYDNWTHVGEHVERNWLSIRRVPCNKPSTCWSVLICCKKNFLSYILNIYIYLYSMYSSFFLINVCNQGKNLCSLCIYCCFRII